MPDNNPTSQSPSRLESAINFLVAPFKAAAEDWKPVQASIERFVANPLDMGGLVKPDCENPGTSWAAHRASEQACAQGAQIEVKQPTRGM
jgi:hypothetical protein